MKLSDCEITHRHIRGVNVTFLFGSRPLTDDDCAALLAEYAEVYGPQPVAPAYVSHAAGWQTLQFTELLHADDLQPEVDRLTAELASAREVIAARDAEVAEMAAKVVSMEEAAKAREVAPAAGKPKKGA